MHSVVRDRRDLQVGDLGEVRLPQLRTSTLAQRGGARCSGDIRRSGLSECELLIRVDGLNEERGGARGGLLRVVSDGSERRRDTVLLQRVEVDLLLLGELSSGHILLSQLRGGGQTLLSVLQLLHSLPDGSHADSRHAETRVHEG